MPYPWLHEFMILHVQLGLYFSDVMFFMQPFMREPLNYCPKQKEKLSAVKDEKSAFIFNLYVYLFDEKSGFTEISLERVKIPCQYTFPPQLSKVFRLRALAFSALCFLN